MDWHKILVPTKLQTDTVIALFLLKNFGEEKYPGISKALFEISSLLPAGETAESLEKRGILCLDVGGGALDHHSYKEKITASRIIAKTLNLKEDLALERLLILGERCDFFGKGIISKDPIDRTFGLPGLIVSLNKEYLNNPEKVFEVINPILSAHYNEEKKRTYELPTLFQQKLKNGEAITYEAIQKKKHIRIVELDSDDQSIAGYLRARQGGDFDVVVLWLSSGHCNIITRSFRNLDLRSLVALLRKSELMMKGKESGAEMEHLSSSGRIGEIEEWYYDPNTNSIQNGGINPKGVPATKIPKVKMTEIVKLGLEERLWSPVAKSKKDYIAVVLDQVDQDELKKIAIYPSIYAHHMTVVYNPNEEQIKKYEKYIGQKVVLNVKGIAQDEKGQALLVEGFQSENKYPHVTISCRGVDPVYSNELLDNARINPTEIKMLHGQVCLVKG